MRPSVSRGGLESSNSARALGLTDQVVLAGDGFYRLQARQDDLNRLAYAVRERGREIDFRKLFPPYPPGQAEQMALLDKMSGLQKLAPGWLSDQGSQEIETMALAEQVSRDSQRLLAGLTSQQSLSNNRALLEGVAQSSPMI